jgi:hypothetical protein
VDGDADGGEHDHDNVSAIIEDDDEEEAAPLVRTASAPVAKPTPVAAPAPAAASGGDAASKKKIVRKV